MAKLWSLALALLVGAGVWAAPAMAGSSDVADLGDIHRSGGEDTAAAGTLGPSGLKFVTEKFELRMTTRVQVRATLQHEVANGSDGTNGRDFINFRIRRAKTGFSGHIFEKNWKYRLLLNWTAGTNIVENAVFTYEMQKEFALSAGQDKLNWNWEEFTSSGSQLFVDRSYVNEVFNQDYAKGIWANGWFGDDAPMLKYWFGIYNGVLAGNNDFRNADMAQRADSFSQFVDSDMMINLRLETHPMGNVANKMYDDRSADANDKMLLAFGLGLNWFASQFNDGTLRPDTVGTPTASGRFRTTQDTLAVTVDGHLRYMGLSVDVAFFFRHTEFHNRGSTAFDPRNRAGTANVTDTGFTLDVAYFIMPREFNVGARFGVVNADEFWGGGSSNRDQSIRPDTTEVGVVANYFLAGDNLKLTLDILYVNQQLAFAGSNSVLGVYNAPGARPGVAGSNPDKSDNNALWIMRLQLQWIF